MWVGPAAIGVTFTVPVVPLQVVVPELHDKYVLKVVAGEIAVQVTVPAASPVSVKVAVQFGRTVTGPLFPNPELVVIV
jgi:hypothetical protein